MLIVAGWGLTWACTAVGIHLYGRIFGADVDSIKVVAGQVPPLAAAPPPAAPAIAPGPEPITASAATPRDEVEISCRDPRFRAIRRAAREYCRAPADDEDRTFLCPRVTTQLRSCRTTPSLSLLHERECHTAHSRTICHDFRATLPSEDEIVPFVALDRPAGRWKVLQLEYDDLERP